MKIVANMLVNSQYILLKKITDQFVAKSNRNNNSNNNFDLIISKNK